MSSGKAAGNGGETEALDVKGEELVPGGGGVHGKAVCEISELVN